MEVASSIGLTLNSLTFSMIMKSAPTSFEGIQILVLEFGIFARPLALFLAEKIITDDS